jgi:hypothetical protein
MSMLATSHNPFAFNILTVNLYSSKILAAFMGQIFDSTGPREEEGGGGIPNPWLVFTRNRGNSRSGPRWCTRAWGPLRLRSGQAFDCVAASLRETVTPLRMTAWWRRGNRTAPIVSRGCSGCRLRNSLRIALLAGLSSGFTLRRVTTESEGVEP